MIRTILRIILFISIKLYPDHIKYKDYKDYSKEI